MVFLVALVVTVILLVVIWRVIGPDQATSGGNRTRATRPRTVRRAPQVPPDDNLDFLRDLDRRARPEE